MQAFTGNGLILGLFNLGGGEIILVLALVLIFFGAKKLPELAKGLGRGILEFRDATDDIASEAGRSVGGIYGKPAAQALTSDNQVAELYDPAVLKDKEQSRKPAGVRIAARRFLLWVRRWLARVGGSRRSNPAVRES